MLILDAGGGSTEFILGRGRDCFFRQSFPLGAVRMLEDFPHADPPGLAARQTCLDQTAAFLRDAVRPSLVPFLRQTPPLFLVGTGGSAAILARIDGQMARFDRERIESARLDRARVRQWAARLWESPLAERRQIPGLPPERADIIIMGAVIYEAVMETFELPELRVSTRGLRFAALLEPG
jgi:exopolyphosphatase/guanosine-5'-triphosphate,3'-diphosphate pyrophosphatase